MDIEALLVRTRRQVKAVRDDLAALSAYSASGEADQLKHAAARLQRSTHSASNDCERVRGLMRHLRSATMPDAANKLCTGGRPSAARAMMQLYDLTISMSQAQADVGAFLEECLTSLESVQTTMSKPERGGRFLGSA